MVTNKILIRKEKATGKVLNQQLLFDDETTEHVIINELPVIEERPGFIGEYVVQEDGSVIVEYREIPKTEIELLKEQIELLKQSMETNSKDISNLEIEMIK